MSHEIKLGKAPVPGEGRDAVHVAIIPAVAGEDLKPGARVGRRLGGDRFFEKVPRIDGIVDPFLSGPVNQGYMFWLCLFPGTVTGMRHCWSHPHFKEESLAADAPSAESVEWLRANEQEYGYDTSGLLQGIVSGEGYCFGDDNGPYDFARTREFWEHVEGATGRRFYESDRENIPFRCAC